MEIAWLVLFAALLLGGAFLLTQMLTRSRRNEGSEHGGGWDGRSSGVDYTDHT